jgi:hypothetical protein
MMGNGPTSVELTQFILRCQRGISQAVSDHRIGGQGVGHSVGPRVITLRFAPAHATNPMINTLLNMGPAIEISAQLAGVTVRQEGGLICVDVPNPWAGPVAAHDLHGRGLVVPLGVAGGRGDEVIWLDWRTVTHLLVQGGSGSCKTTAVQAILWQLAVQNPAYALRFVVLCQPNKLDDWQPVGRAPHTWAIVTDPLEGLAAAQWAAEQAKAARPASAPDVFFVVDDLSAWLRDVDLGPAVELIADMGRKSRIRLLANTHTNNKGGTGGTSVKNIATKLLLAVGDRQTAAAIAGKASGAEKLGRVGDALLINDGQNLRVGVAAAWPEDWRRWKTERDANYRPWLALLGQGGALSTDTSTSTDAGAHARGGDVDGNARMFLGAGAGASAGARGKVLQLPTGKVRKQPLPTPAELALIAEAQLPLPSKHVPTPEDGRLFLALLHEQETMTKACQKAYGFKNPHTYDLFLAGLALCGAALAAETDATDSQEASA